MPTPDPHAVRICLFNGPRVTVGDEEASRFPTRHAAAILTLLALKPRQPISRDDIADTLWPDEALDASRRRIREHLYRLRQSIPNGRDLILTDGDFIRLSQEISISVDVLEFDKLLKQASETEDADGKIKLLGQADELNSGPFAPELDWPRFDAIRTRYAQMRLELLRALSLLFAETDFKRAIEYVKRAVDADPLCEGAHEELIRLFVRAGRSEEARRQYRELEKGLKRELGAEPSREITEFVKSINGASAHGPFPRILAGVRIAMPGRRATRVYGAAAALSLCVALFTLLAWKPWRRPPHKPEQRIAKIVELRGLIAKATDPREKYELYRERAYQCVELGEEAWGAWWGPDEGVWVARLAQIDPDIEHSLAWLTENNPAREIQLSGALARYWVFPDERLNVEAHWLELAQHYNGRVEDRFEARALTGLSRYYLLKAKAQAKPGLVLALNAYKRYNNCNDVWGQAYALRHVALHQHYQQINVDAIRNFRKALELFKQIRNERGLAQTYQCMGYIDPQELSETNKPAERLIRVLNASKMFRELKNSRGMQEIQQNLVIVARRTPYSLETQSALQDLETECREWLDIAIRENDIPHRHQLWIMLANTALKLKHRATMAECLFPLRWTTAHEHLTVDYVGRIDGAYGKYRRLDPQKEERITKFREDIGTLPLSQSQRSLWVSAVEAGKNMSLEDATRLAASR